MFGDFEKKVKEFRDFFLNLLDKILFRVYTLNYKAQVEKARKRALKNGANGSSTLPPVFKGFYFGV
jgi:hypothetical protein